MGPHLSFWKLGLTFGPTRARVEGLTVRKGSAHEGPKEGLHKGPGEGPPERKTYAQPPTPHKGQIRSSHVTFDFGGRFNEAGGQLDGTIVLPWMHWSSPAIHSGFAM